ncbi:MAG: sugar ABC transporter permease [Clostridium sp.]|nr:sugar ABC transporter permease [Clostridium sp.]
MKKRKKSKHKRIEEFKDFLTVLPALIFFGVFIYYPLGELFRISFTNWNLIKDEFKYVGFRNYKWLFAGSGWDQLVNALKVTFTYTIAEVFVTLVFGLLLALLFNKMTKMYNSFRTILFMPKYIGVSTAGIVFTWILNGRYGILNYLLGTVGIKGPDWLTNEKTALAGVLILTTWRVVGYAMLIYLSAMQGIAKDYYEAASLDGASKTQQFFKITIPLLSPTTLFLFVTTFIASMKVFQSIDVMTGGGPYKATNVMVYWIYRLAFVEFRVDRASVVAVLFFLILLIITAITMRISENSVNYDG